MSNIDTLKAAGLMTAGAALTATDTATINSLTTDEVNALISVYNKVGLNFLSRNCGSNDPAAGAAHAIGIVF